MSDLFVDLTNFGSLFNSSSEYTNGFMTRAYAVTDVEDVGSDEPNERGESEGEGEGEGEEDDGGNDNPRDNGIGGANACDDDSLSPDTSMMSVFSSNGSVDCRLIDKINEGVR
jgi:hypothetical protein